MERSLHFLLIMAHALYVFVTLVIMQRAVMQPTATQRSANPNSPMKKRPKIAKVVQSASCEVCKVDCNSKDVLDKPKEEKKLTAASKPVPPPPPPDSTSDASATCTSDDSTSDASATCNNTIIGPQENPSEGKSSGSKRGKSRAAETARWCDKCWVVCDRETVFSYHLSGVKHAFMEKRDAIKMVRIVHSGHLIL